MGFNMIFLFTFGGTFALIGLIFAGIGLGFGLRRRKRRMLCTASTQGYIQSLTPRPVIAFTVGELSYEKPFPLSSNRAYAVGQGFTVHYDPSDPGNGYVEGEDLPERLLIGIFGGLGILFIVIAAATAIILL